MNEAIEKLREQVDTCTRMESWYDTELKRNNHVTADQIEVYRLMEEQKKNKQLKQSCIEAIDVLKSKN